jgi:hypothetical protein
MTAAYGSPDRADVARAAQLLQQPLDPARTVCLAVADEAATRAAIAGLANARGGQLLLGVRADETGTRVIDLHGIDPVWLDEHLSNLTLEIDPPLPEMVSLQTLPLPGGGAVGLISVRQSPIPPHLDRTNGIVFLHEPGSPRPIRSRSELDRLYRKGRALNERAERLIEATAERLTLAHFGHYGLAVVACLREPAANPYLWARAHPEAFADAADPFVEQWGFTSALARATTGEVELRSEREISGVLRVGRAGYALAGEILKRPQGDVIASDAELCEHLSRLVGSACRILAHSDGRVIVPRLLCDGLKGTKIRQSESSGSESDASAIDVLNVPGPAGDPRDGTYQRQLARDFGRALLAPFGLRDLADEAR